MGFLFHHRRDIVVMPPFGNNWIQKFKRESSEFTLFVRGVTSVLRLLVGYDQKNYWVRQLGTHFKSSIQASRNESYIKLDNDRKNRRPEQYWQGVIEERTKLYELEQDEVLYENLQNSILELKEKMQRKKKRLIALSNMLSVDATVHNNPDDHSKNDHNVDNNPNVNRDNFDHSDFNNINLDKSTNIGLTIISPITNRRRKQRERDATYTASRSYHYNHTNISIMTENIQEESIINDISEFINSDTLNCSDNEV
ncbi:33909_t:CDS:2, partial [Gigaspora margarita]